MTDDPLVEICIPGVPVPMPRLRVNRKFGTFYTPMTTTKRGRKISNGVGEFRQAVALLVPALAPTTIITKPVRVDCLYLFPRQAHKVWKQKPMVRYLHNEKPDIDNLDKLLFDSITRAKHVAGVDEEGKPKLVGYIWHDDTQVQCGFHEKWYCAGDEEPGTYVQIWVMDKTA